MTLPGLNLETFLCIFRLYLEAGVLVPGRHVLWRAR